MPLFRSSTALFVTFPLYGILSHEHFDPYYSSLQTMFCLFIFHCIMLSVCHVYTIFTLFAFRMSTISICIFSYHQQGLQTGRHADQLVFRQHSAPLPQRVFQK